MKKLSLVLTCLLVASLLTLWIGVRQTTHDSVAIRILSRAFDSSDNYTVTFDVTNISDHALTIVCVSLGEWSGPHSLPAQSARTYSLLDEDPSGIVNGPVQVRYTSAYGAFKEGADRLLAERLGTPFRLIKWKTVEAPGKPLPNKISQATAVVVFLLVLSPVTAAPEFFRLIWRKGRS